MTYIFSLINPQQSRRRCDQMDMAMTPQSFHRVQSIHYNSQTFSTLTRRNPLSLFQCYIIKHLHCENETLVAVIPFLSQFSILFIYCLTCSPPEYTRHIFCWTVSSHNHKNETRILNYHISMSDVTKRLISMFYGSFERFS